MADQPNRPPVPPKGPMTERERQLLDIIGRAVLAANEMGAAMLGMMAFVLGDEGQVLSASDVERMLAGKGGEPVATEAEQLGEAPKTFGRKRREEQAAATTQQPEQSP